MFESRQDAAQLLTVKLLKTVEDKDIAVLALARGAVPMGRMIADYLSCPFDTIVCKKIGAPLNIEFAIGAVAPTIVFTKDACDFIIRKNINSLNETDVKQFANLIKKYARPISDIRASAWYREEVLINLSETILK